MYPNLRFPAPLYPYSSSTSTSSSHTNPAARSSLQAASSNNPSRANKGIMKHAGFFLAALFCTVLINATAWGQTTIAVQDFETTPATPTWTFTTTGTFVTSTGNSNTTDLPASSSFAVEGSTGKAWTVTNATATNTFANINTSGYTGVTVTFRVAAFSIGSTTNGIDPADTLTASISTDGGTNYSAEVRVQGPTANNAVWHYSTGTGNASATYDGDSSPTVYAPSATGSRTTDGYSTVTISIPNGTSQVRLRIGLINNSANERWAVDKVIIQGTPISPPTVTTNAATSVGTTTATLNGTVNANSSSTAVTFQYGLDTNYGSTVTATQSPVTGSSNTSVSANITGLTPNTTYHYRVVGTNAGGTTNGADQTFTTTPLAPTATTNAATNVGTTTATLNATVNANGASTTVTFQYGLDTNYGSSVTATQSPVTGSSNTAVSANLTGLSPGTTYHYRVVATNSGGTTNGADQTFTTTAAYTISGQITKDGAALSGATVTLGGSSSGSTTTDSSGNYSFTNVTAGGNYTVTPSFAGFSFTPASRSFNSLAANQTGASFTATALVIISEFRLQGPTSTTDEFIELYNTTSSSINISGYTLTSSDGQLSLTLPSATIPGYGHYLITNTSGYSLGNAAQGLGVGDQNYSEASSRFESTGGTSLISGDQVDVAPGDGGYVIDIASDAGLALGNGLGGVLDAVGFTTSSSTYREGSGLAPVSTPGEYSFVRKMTTSGFPQDTADNVSDFWFVAVDPAAIASPTAVLGAPGPENSSSPINRTSQMRSSLIDSGGSLSNGNAARDTNAFVYTRPAGGTISFPAGTLSLRRRITNTTGANVTRLRLRITTLSTLNSPGYSAGGTQADVRAINSEAVEVTLTSNGTTVTAQGVTLEEPPTQPEGGGYNATLEIPLSAATFPSGLPNNQSVVVNIRFGVKQGGQFRFSYTVEVLP